jgi:adenylate kinase family enzyme
MIHRLHILGASGSGITTLGRALAERLQYPHVDTDDYFWLPTEPPFTHQRARTERQQLLMDDVTAGIVLGYLFFEELKWTITRL